MHQYPAFLARVLDSYGFHDAATIGGPITGVDVDVQGVQAQRTMVAVTAAGERTHLGAALETGERLVRAPASEALHA